MAVYKQPCIHCNTLIGQDVWFCPSCGSYSPFSYLCPSCLHAIKKKDAICPGCGRPLYIACPTCQKRTFAQEFCEQCGAGLTIRCQNPHCGAMQFFENSKCTTCGKKLPASLLPDMSAAAAIDNKNV